MLLIKEAHVLFPALACKELIRKRETAVRDLEGMPGPDRAVLLERSIFGMPVPEMTADSLHATQTPAFDRVMEKAARALRKRAISADGGQPQLKAQKCNPWVPRWSFQNSAVPSDGRHADAGAALIVASPNSAKQADILRSSGFRVVACTLPSRSYQEFFKAVATCGARRHCRHLVVVSSLAGDMGSGMALACRLVGGFLTDLQAVGRVPKSGPEGIQYQFHAEKPRFVALSKGLASEMPDLPHVLLAAASLDGSRLKVASDHHDVERAYAKYKEKRGPNSKPWLSMRIAATDAELKALTSKRKKFPHLYCSKCDFLDFFGCSVEGDAICPGKW